MVYADELSETGIQEAILAGHTYVKFFSSDGPDLRLNARSLDGPGKGPRAMMGDRLKAGRAAFEARVIGGAPSPEPRTLVVFRDGKPWLTAPVTSDDFTFAFTADFPGDCRLQLLRGSAIEALSNPISLEPSPRHGKRPPR